MQRRHRTGHCKRRFPPRDSPGAFPRLGVVGDAREVPAQLDHGGQLALLLEHTTDGGGFGFGDTEHEPACTGIGATGKRQPSGRPRKADPGTAWRWQTGANPADPATFWHPSRVTWSVRASTGQSEHPQVNKAHNTGLNTFNSSST